MNKVIEACLQKFESEYVRSERLNRFSKRYDDLVKKLDRDTARELTGILTEMQVIQQAEFFEAGFNYGLSLHS